MINKAELERLAERWRSIAKHAGMARAKALVQCAHELNVALAASCDQPAGEPVPLPEPNHQRLVGTGPVPCWQSYYSADQLRTHAETVAAPLREKLAEAERIALRAENAAMDIANRLVDAERERDADKFRADRAEKLIEVWRLAAHEAVRERDEARTLRFHQIETAPKDNKALLLLARFGENGELQELDFDGIWKSDSESWEMPQVYHYWASANGIEEPTHWAYQSIAIDSAMGDEKP